MPRAYILFEHARTYFDAIDPGRSLSRSAALWCQRLRSARMLWHTDAHAYKVEPCGLARARSRTWPEQLCAYIHSSCAACAKCRRHYSLCPWCNTEMGRSSAVASSRVARSPIMQTHDADHAACPRTCAAGSPQRKPPVDVYYKRIPWTAWTLYFLLFFGAHKLMIGKPLCTTVG